MSVESERIGAYLAAVDKNYNAEAQLLGVVCHAAGYHSRLPSGMRVHPTRESLNYALALLQAGGVANVGRAGAIIRKIVSLQDQDPFSGTYGIWSWYMEEPVDRMDPPDWNWADFCGAILAQMLRDHGEVLPVDLVAAMRESLGHAAWCIFRRNVRLDYTNIAIMGGGVAALAGELLHEPRLIGFGRARLERVLSLVRYHGSFTEYNSPTYTMVVLEECERVLHVSRDQGVIGAAEALRQTAWEIIAEHFHPATQQWAGPHARAYTGHISSSLARYLTETTGVAIAPHPSVLKEAEPDMPRLVPALACPDHLLGLFSGRSARPIELQRRFIRREDPAAPPPVKFSSDALVVRGVKLMPQYRYGDRCGTTWFSDTAVLGTINHEDTWAQRRFLLGYLKTDRDLAVTLRLRFLHDGRDFASGFVRQAQRGPRVLSALTLLSDRGDWHPHFDHPADNVFSAEDFRLRYELRGEGVILDPPESGRFCLRAGGHCVVIQGSPGWFGGQPVHWECGQDRDCVFVDAVCYQGPRTGFRFDESLSVQLVGGLELLAGDQTPSQVPAQIQNGDAGAFVAQWEGLSLSVPASLDRYPG